MSQRFRLGLASVVVGAVATFVLAAAPSDAATPKPCRAAASLAKSGRTADAQAAYLELLKTEPVPACAEAGLRRLARREFSAAGGLIHSGFRDEAMKRIEDGRAASPSAPVPLELRRFVVAQRTFEKVRKLREAGQEDEAKELLQAYLAALEKRGQRTPAGGLPADMNAIVEDDEGPALQWLRDFGGWLEDQGLLLLAVVLVGLLLILAEALPRLRRLFTRKPRVAIATFKGGPSDGGLAKAFTEELHEAVNNAGELLGGTRADLSLPPASREPLPASVTDAFPELGVVEAIVTLIPRLIPTRDRALNGYLLPNTARGVGASLSLAKSNGGLIRQVTLRQADYGTPSPNGDGSATDYAMLMPPATYWVRSAIRNGDSSWRRHALFAAGAYQQQAGHLGDARRLYEQALTLDPPLPGALINLGALDIKAGSDLGDPDFAAIDRGIARIESAIELLRPSAVPL